MKLILKTGLLAAMVFALVGASPAHAIFGQVGTASGCKAGKAKCVTKLKSCMLGCYGKAFKGGTTVDGACLDKCRTGFLADPATGKGCMEKLDTKNANCGTSLGDAAVVRSKVEAHVLELVGLLNPQGGNPANGCLAGKAKCVVKYNSCVLGIVGKAFKAGTTPGSFAKCDAILTNAGVPPKASCVQKLETKNPTGPTACRTFDDQGVLKTADDAFVNDLIYGWVGGGDLDAQRCSNDTSIRCTNNGPCGAGTCQFFFGSPLPLAAGGVASCVVSQWNGGITGTFEQENGKSAGNASVLSRVYTGSNTIDQPCPICTGADIPNDGALNGVCTGGARNGMSCDRNGESPIPSFGYTSLDCPPVGGTLVGSLPVDLSNTNTATVTRTLSAASPNCNGAPGLKCMCGSCSGNSSVPCFGDADCALAGAGTCTNAAGEPRKPNACLDDTTNPAPPQCGATTTPGEGGCVEGPFDLHCQVEKFRSCTVDSDCGTPGDKCVSEARACFPGYNGTVGDSIAAVGTHDSTPNNHTGTSTFASVFCVAPTSSSAVNSAGGLPGPGRLALGGVASEDGNNASDVGADACPTVATFLPTAKGGVLDTGWTGLAHNASVVGQGKVTVGVTGCTGTPPNCHCTYTGPVAN